MTLLDKIAARNAARTPTETERIAALPSVDYFQREDLTDELRESGAFALRPIQSAALHAIREVGGLFGPIGVGFGKTWIALLAGTVLDADLAIIMTKARLVPAMERERKRLEKMFSLVPIRVLSYGFLSRPESSELLDELVAPFERVVIVADEAHCLASLSSARTRRVVRLFQNRPDLRFVAMSGTLLRKSVEDCAHLAELALRERSPFPRNRAHLNAWKETLDVDGRPGPEHWSIMRPIADVGDLRGKARQNAIREAFRDRLKSSAGVVCSESSALGVSLEMVPVWLEFPEKLREMTDRAARDYIDPDGEPFETDVEQWRTFRELAAGFHYVWEWAGEPDREWLDARRDWLRNVRSELARRAGPAYDSPALVRARIEVEIALGEKRRAIHTALEKWRLVEDRPQPPTVAIWIDRFLIADAVALADQIGEPVIVWYMSDAVGVALGEAGLDVFGAGSDLESIEEPRTVAASISVHGTGTNLQKWNRAIVVEPPSSGSTWEQLLGRLHRPGQTADDVVFYVYEHAIAFAVALEKARQNARFIESTTGNPQKLRFLTRAEEIQR